MKTLAITITLLGGLLLAPVSSLRAQETRFFRIVGPVPTTITEVTAEGAVTWTNVATNATFTVQTATALPDATNWVDWVQVPVTNAVTVHRVFDPNPPSGMVLIPAGRFTMGDTFNEGATDEHPTHAVHVSAFYMDKCEVSKALWDEVYDWAVSRPAKVRYSFQYGAQGKAANHPVHGLNWFDCLKWCNARSEKEGLVPCYYSDAELATIYRTGTGTPYAKWNASGYRLPTEAEWEKAARGGLSAKRFPWGDTMSHSQANYRSSTAYAYDLSGATAYHPAYNDGTTPYTSPVGSFAPNGYGLHDMAGNLLEWCWDWYDANWYANSQATQEDSKGPQSGSSRLLRGGCWNQSAGKARCATRDSLTPSTAGVGGNTFRCVKGL